jgi:hypothetical protein
MTKFVWLIVVTAVALQRPLPRVAAHQGQTRPCAGSCLRSPELGRDAYRHPANAKIKLGDCPQRSSTAYLIGGAYWMPPLLQSEFSPRGIFKFDSAPTLRS